MDVGLLAIAPTPRDVLCAVARRHLQNAVAPKSSGYQQVRNAGAFATRLEGRSTFVQSRAESQLGSPQWAIATTRCWLSARSL
jgi:hypothetical protein